MNAAEAWFRSTELDRTTFPEFRARIRASDEESATVEPRSYPGYPRFALPRPRPRWRPALDHALSARRCCRSLTVDLPSARQLGRLLFFGHGLHATGGRGPVPSAGGLQALELYVSILQEGWLSAGAYHYDRPGHFLSQISPHADRAVWRSHVPSLDQVDGGGLLWILVGDAARVAARYGERAHRFLLLEAGHLMQNLCLLSVSLGLCTVPLGGFFERAIGRELALPATDGVLYVGVCGKPTGPLYLSG
jgi:SagB-type dehydrogenase family enzyme